MWYSRQVRASARNRHSRPKMAAILMASRGTEGLPDIQGRFPAPGTHKIVWTMGRDGRIDRIWANRGHMESWGFGVHASETSDYKENRR